MRARRVLACLAAAVTVAGGVSLAAAPAASAATSTVDCTSMPTSFDYTVSPDETLTLALVNCGSVTLQVGRRSPAYSIVTNPSADNPWCSRTAFAPCQSSSTGNYTRVAIVGGPVDKVLGLVFYVNDVPIYMTVATPPPDPEADPIPIPAWLQAYGRAGRDASCLASWGPSWQHWAESITGGWVCTRSIPSLG